MHVVFSFFLEKVPSLGCFALLFLEQSLPVFVSLHPSWPKSVSSFFPTKLKNLLHRGCRATWLRSNQHLQVLAKWSTIKLWARLGWCSRKWLLSESLQSGQQTENVEIPPNNLTPHFQQEIHVSSPESSEHLLYISGWRVQVIPFRWPNGIARLVTQFVYVCGGFRQLNAWPPPFSPYFSKSSDLCALDTCIRSQHKCLSTCNWLSPSRCHGNIHRATSGIFADLGIMNHDRWPSWISIFLSPLGPLGNPVSNKAWRSLPWEVIALWT